MACLLCLAWSMPVRASGSQRDIGQYRRTRWQAEQGLADGNIQSIAQTPDGYLWIATKNNLLRFDGHRFTPLLTPEKEPLKRVLSLSVDRAGALWIRTQDARLIRLDDGVPTPVSYPQQEQLGVVAMSPSQTDGLYTTNLNRNTVYIHGNQAESIPLHSRSLMLSIAQGTDRKVWVGTNDQGLLVWDGNTTLPVMPPSIDRKINCLFPGSNGSIWIGTDDGLALWDGSQFRAGLLTGPGMRHLQVLTILEDRSHTLWLGTSRGLIRYTAKGAQWLPGEGGHEGAAVTALTEDREGDIWFGNGPVLERLEATALMRVADTSRDAWGAVFVDPHGRAWLAKRDGGLYWSQGGALHPVTADGLDKDVTYSMDGDGNNIWIGRRDHGLTRLQLNGERIEAKTWTVADGLAQNHVSTVRVFPGGDVWAGTLTGGLSHYAEGRFTTLDERDGLPSNTVTALEHDADGHLWVGTPDGVCSLEGHRCVQPARAKALPSREIVSLLADPEGGMLIGTANGLARVHAGKLERLAFSGGPRRSVLGLAFDRAQTLWLATDRDVMSAPWRSILAGGHPDERIYGPEDWGPEDSLPSGAGMRRSRSMVADGSGAVMLSTASGVFVTGSDEMPPSPALPHVESIAADGTSLGLHLPRVPAGTNRISFTFAGLNLRAPERVRLRYRLDAFDADWVEAGDNRQATYTNLAPGKYTFRVRAASRANAWSPQESEATITVMPFYWQMPQVQLAFAVFLGLCLLLFYRARTHHLLARASLLAEERLRERTRIARELHDTLLQGFISSLMHLHVAAQEIPDASSLRGKIDPVLDVMERVIEEARVAVVELRAPDANVCDLHTDTSNLLIGLRRRTNMELILSSSGAPRGIAPFVFTELRRILQEAVENAVRHSNAHQVRIEIVYGRFRLRLHVEDDGCGMDKATLEHGRERHWGLAGMKERAARIRARLRITSTLGAGTRVAVSVPASSAYARANGSQKNGSSSA